MGRRALIKIVQGDSVSIADEGGHAPSGDLHLAARRALHSAKARAGGQIDAPGCDDTSLVKPSDYQLAVGLIACSLVGDGYTVEIFPSAVPFDDVS